MDVKKPLQIILLISIIGFSSIRILPEETITQEALDKVVSQLKVAQENKDNINAELYGERAFELGKKLYGDNHPTVAKLALVYAKLLLVNLSKKENPQKNNKLLKLPSKAVALYELSINIYQLKNGNNAPELIIPYLDLAYTYNRYKRTMKSFDYYERAIKIIENNKGENTPDLIMPLMKLARVNKHFEKNNIQTFKRALAIAETNKKDDPIFRADISFGIGKNMSQLRKGKRGLRKSRDYLQDAYDTYHKYLKDTDNRLINSTFILANIQAKLGNYSKAEPLLLELISSFDKSRQEAHPVALATSALLVKIYEKLGESDKATHFCQAIGKAKPWDDNREQVAIFIVNPKWPRSALRFGKEGHVNVTFTIDKEGFVKDPKVRKTSGHKEFGPSALKAIKQWRFAPKFEKGHPVDARVAYTLNFKLVND